MPIAVKDISAIASKWSTRAQAAGPDYAAGVKNPNVDWAGPTAAAADAWGQGVAQAVSDQRFQKGVTQAGTAKWQQNASTKGAQRYPQGVQGAQGAYNAGFSPYLQLIANLQLPPRSPRGSPNNIQRVTAVASALHAKKISG